MARIKQVLEILGGVGLGVGAMYFLDPKMGKRRRALVRDKANHAAHAVGDVGKQIGKTSRDLRNRTQGIVAGVTSSMKSLPASDGTLQERVGSVAGHILSQPKGVQIKVSGGVVTLKGKLSTDEHVRLLKKVGKVQGVTEVQDHLAVNGEMQANGRDGKNSWMRPTGITLASTAAGALATYGAKRVGLIK